MATYTVDGLTRRQFLRVSGLTAAATLAAACVVPTPPASPEPAPPVVAPTTPPVVPVAPAAPASRYSEAPVLAELVAKGELPPVDDRLPENPDVVAPVESIGKHGGAWRRGFSGVSDRWGPTKLKANNLLWYTQEIILRPALVESWEINADASTWTFRLRKGMNWSDGTPFTSEAFQWFYDHHVRNSEIQPILPGDRARFCAGSRRRRPSTNGGEHHDVATYGHTVRPRPARGPGPGRLGRARGRLPAAGLRPTGQRSLRIARLTTRQPSGGTTGPRPRWTEIWAL